MIEQTRKKFRHGELEVEFSGPKEPGESTAQRVYLKHLAMVSMMHAGTTEIKNYQAYLLNDQEFRECAEDLLEVNMQGPLWVDVFFRATAKEAQKMQAEIDNQAYSENQNFGMF